MTPVPAKGFPSGLWRPQPYSRRAASRATFMSGSQTPRATSGVAPSAVRAIMRHVSPASRAGLAVILIWASLIWMGHWVQTSGRGHPQESKEPASSSGACIHIWTGTPLRSACWRAWRRGRGTSATQARMTCPPVSRREWSRCGGASASMAVLSASCQPFNCCVQYSDNLSMSVQRSSRPAQESWAMPQEMPWFAMACLRLCRLPAISSMLEKSSGMCRGNRRG